MTGRARRCLRATVGGLLLTAAAVVVVGPGDPAEAVNVRSGADVVQQVTLGGHVSLQPLVVDGLAPGSAVTQRFEVHRPTARAGGTYAMAVSDVQDLEHGCMHSEAADGDGTCGDAAGEGELSQQLLLEHRWSPATADCKDAASPTSGDTMAVLADHELRAPDSTGRADTACLVLVLRLPREADNLVQTDATRFSLRIGLVDGGFTGGEGELSPAAGGLLPATGFGLLRRVALAGLLALAGAGLLAAGRVRD